MIKQSQGWLARVGLTSSFQTYNISQFYPLLHHTLQVTAWSQDQLKKPCPQDKQQDRKAKAEKHIHQHLARGDGVGRINLRGHF